MRIPLCSHSTAATHFIRRGLPARGRWEAPARAVTMMGVRFPKPQRILCWKSAGVLFPRSNSSGYWTGEERKRRGSSETSSGGMSLVYSTDHLFIFRFFRRTFFLSLSFVSLSTYLCPTAKSCRTTNFR